MSGADTESYSAGKGGLLALTHVLAVSLAPDVRVNCVSPGWIETKDYAGLRAARIMRNIPQAMWGGRRMLRNCRVAARR